MAASSDQHELVITRVIDAPRPLVFKAWTQPEHIARWWGPRGFTTIHCEMDVRVAGAYRFGMRSPQGTEHWKRGIYREIVEPERIVFTFAWENPGDDQPHDELLTTVTFDEFGTRTRLTLRQRPFPTTEHRDSHHTGWSSTLERFTEYLASQLAS
ncbi:MAG TPA: SRPBCC domain-containing protein [Acetobacteraceae bacterium]|nr:SRPBCC domain-containing protein [Acetobacteraceae bacterium]